MSKKKHHAEEHVNHERWLVSYADFITLLFAFFVVLFSSSSVEHSKTNKSGLAIEAAFDSFSIFKDPSGDSFEPSDKGGSGGSAQRSREVLVVSDTESSKIAPAQLNPNETTEKIVPKGDPALNENTGFLTPPDDIVGQKHKELLEMIDARKWNNYLSAVIDERGLVISISDSVLFEAGNNTLLPSSGEFLKNLGGLLKNIPNQVRVEGHTDDRDASDNKFSSNLDLSIMRSLFIINWLEEKYQIDTSRFIAAGYGSYNPIADNDSEEGRQKNRRVNIVVLSKDAEKKEAPIHEKIIKTQAKPDTNVPVNMQSHPLVKFQNETPKEDKMGTRERNDYDYVPPIKL